MIGEGIDHEVLTATKEAISKLEGLGAICEEVSLEMVKYSVAAYYTITATEAGSNLARYDNLRYGYDFPVEGYEFNSYISKARKKFGTRSNTKNDHWRICTICRSCWKIFSKSNES